MAKQQTPSKPGKKLPKRTGRPNPKARRARCWQRGQVRKKLRIAAQNRRHAANLHRRVVGEPTPWETACAARRARRTNG